MPGPEQPPIIITTVDEKRDLEVHARCLMQEHKVSVDMTDPSSYTEIAQKLGLLPKVVIVPVDTTEQ